MPATGRDYAQVHLSIWGDDNFRDLTPAAQHLYLVLLTAPGLTYAGVDEWHPGRIAARAAGWTPDDVRDAAAELIHHLFIVVDEDTGEYLIRTFIRHDGLMKQRNLGVSMAKARALVSSRGIRGVIVHELKALHDARPELAAFKADAVRDAMDNPPIDPATYPCGDPFIHPAGHLTADPGVDPAVEGESTPDADPANNPGVEGQPGGQPRGRHRPRPYNSTCNRTDPPTPKEGLTQDREASPARAGAHPGAGAREAGPAPESLPPEWVEEPSLARCATHATVDAPPPCGGCAAARRAAMAARTAAEARAREEMRARETAIGPCRLCDHAGWIIDQHSGAAVEPAIRCTHDAAGNAAIIDAAKQRALAARRRRGTDGPEDLSPEGLRRWRAEHLARRSAGHSGDEHPDPRHDPAPTPETPRAAGAAAANPA